MRRNLLGLIALGLLAFAAIACMSPRFAAYLPAGMIGLRIGMVLVVLWLAWPDLVRLPRWTRFALPIAVIVAIYARGVLVYAAPLLAAALAVFLVYRRLRRPA